MIKISKIQKNKLKKAKLDLIKIRLVLKKEPIVQKMFKEYKVNLSQIDKVHIMFDDALDVSAKTVNGKIFLNAEMLDEKWYNYMHYVIHELTHVLQHITGKCNNGVYSDRNYLNNPSEIEAFKNQIDFKQETEDKQELGHYLKRLFDRHNLSKKERKQKILELL